MASEDLEKGQSKSYHPLDEAQSSSTPHPAILGLFTLLLMALIWVPIWYLGLLRQILAQVLGPVIAVLSLLALLPVLLIGLKHLRIHIVESVEYHKEHLKEHVSTAMHSKMEIMKDTLEGVVGGSITEGLHKFEKKICEFEEKMMKHLEQMPEELKAAVSAEFKAMKSITAEGEGWGWHHHAKK